VNSKTRRQAYLLVALAVVLAAVIYVRYGSDDDFATTPASQAGTAAAPSNQQAGRGASQNMPVTDVKLEALQHDEEALASSERNPFRFKPKAPPPAPVSRPVATPVFTPPPPTGPPPPPPIPLRFIGFADPAGQTGRVAILADARGNAFFGKEGDIIEGRYRVLRIAPESVDVAYADGRGRQTLRLSTQ
jgi:hypothetical protein